ncbi:MAG: sulfurase [Pseudomonadota bacterium]
MAILQPTGIEGTVAWAGLVPQRDEGIRAEPVEALELDYGGPVGDVHYGLTRPSCVRVRRQYAKGTEIRNVRQLSIVSREELAEIAAALDVPVVEPAWLGATIMVAGIPSFTLVPPGSRLIAAGGASLVIDMENAPCGFPAQEIDRHHPGHGAAFPKVARHKRGVTAWVERPGRLALGEALALHVPPVRLYPPLAAG